MIYKVCINKEKQRINKKNKDFAEQKRNNYRICSAKALSLYWIQK